MNIMNAPSAPQQNRALLGVAIVAITVFFFALGDVITKQMTMKYPVPIVGGARYVISLLLMFLLFYPRIHA